ncbi:hypothetical protein [Yinghuangia soli]|uniref:Uncharacterized protein n=1 Tax=Yinghuangia soli TaxID=2908204 RepID=A0AA41Q438_9ACTN|nr:hypothetical protein [Yinghuangia soli]MCF2530346.1 hypothetical protein [Yinghuangia soli]
MDHDDAVMVVGPVEALQRVASRLLECGDLADAAPVYPDADHPDLGCCMLHMTPRDDTPPGGYDLFALGIAPAATPEAASAPAPEGDRTRPRRKAPAGLLASAAAALLRRDRTRPGGSQGPGRGPAEPGRHRATPPR